MHQGLHSIREFAWRRISLLDHRHPTSGNTAILLLRTTTTINNNNTAILLLRRHLAPVFQTPLMLECRFFGGNATVPLLGSPTLLGDTQFFGERNSLNLLQRTNSFLRAYIDAFRVIDDSVLLCKTYSISDCPHFVNIENIENIDSRMIN